MITPAIIVLSRYHGRHELRGPSGELVTCYEGEHPDPVASLRRMAEVLNLTVVPLSSDAGQKIAGLAYELPTVFHEFVDVEWTQDSPPCQSFSRPSQRAYYEVVLALMPEGAP